MTKKLVAFATAALLTTSVAALAVAPDAAAASELPHSTAPAASMIATPNTRQPRVAIYNGGVTITVPSSATVYNKALAHIVPRVRVGRGVYKVVANTSLSVYSGARRITHGPGAWLRAGRYTQAVTVGYHSYKYVARYRTVTTKTQHPGGYPDNTACTITAIDDTGSDGSTPGDGLGSPLAATCANSLYPGQHVAIGPDDFTSDSFYDANGNPVPDLSTSTVNEVLTTSGVGFATYYTTAPKRVAYKVLIWTGYHTLTTRRNALVVWDGGFQRVFAGIGSDYGSDDWTTRYFTVPRHWLLGYAYDCSNTYIDSGNWILDVHRRGDPTYADTNLNNDIKSRDTKIWQLTGAGTFRLHIYTECIWAVIVRWR
ncbi:MAG: hypothetical protein ACRDVG_14890 [Jatrophihabitantaceae bacterium]